MNYGKLAANSEKKEKRGRGKGRPWPKGVSGNPSGRAKSKPVTDLLRSIFTDPAVIPGIRKNLIRTLQSKGMAGVILINHSADRLEGKVPDEIQIMDLRELSDEELENKLKALEDARS